MSWGCAASLLFWLRADDAIAGAEGSSISVRSLAGQMSTCAAASAWPGLARDRALSGMGWASQLAAQPEAFPRDTLHAVCGVPSLAPFGRIKQCTDGGKLRRQLKDPPLVRDTVPANPPRKGASPGVFLRLLPPSAVS